MSDNEKTPLQSDGWRQWSENVKGSLEKLDNKIDKLEDKITSHREETLIDITTLKAKSGIIGTIAGVITSAIISVLVGLIVYQLTVGGYNRQHPKTDDRPITPNVTDHIGYILLPREINETDKLFIDEEDDV